MLLLYMWLLACVPNAPLVPKGTVLPEDPERDTGDDDDDEDTRVCTDDSGSVFDTGYAP